MLIWELCATILKLIPVLLVLQVLFCAEIKRTDLMALVELYATIWFCTNAAKVNSMNFMIPRLPADLKDLLEQPAPFRG